MFDFARRALLAALLLLNACAPAPRSANPSPLPLDEITTRKAVLTTVGKEIVAAGNIAADPAYQGQVGAPASGRVAHLFVSPGERVRVGQPLARLHAPELTRARSTYQDATLRLKLATRTLEQRRQQARLGDQSRRPVEEARNELAAARGDEEVARSTVGLARRKLERVRDLFDHGLASRQDLDEAQAASEQAQSRWRQSQRALEVARDHHRREERLAGSGSLVATRILEAENEAAVAQEEVVHSREILHDLGLTPEDASEGLILRAPIAGLVVASHATVGQAVAPDQPLFELLDPSHMWLWLYLYEYEQGKIRPGLPVEIEVEALAGRTFRGFIDYLPPQVEVPSRALRARVAIQNPGGSLRVGMAARGRIRLEKPRQAVTIPARALLAGKRVYVRSAKGFEPREVVPGLEDRDRQTVEIVRGLTVGDEVVVEGANLLQAGEAR